MVIQKDLKLLPPIKESTHDYDAMEKQIKLHFKRLVYYPLLKELEESRTVLQNSKWDLVRALSSGRITFYRGVFSGKFSATTSKELKELGATFDRKNSTFKLAQAELPYDIRHAVSASVTKFEARLSAIDEKLASIVPEELAASLNTSKHFDKALFKVQRSFEKSVQNLTIAPELTPYQRKRIADEWSGNMQLWVKDFAKKEIKELRQNIQKSAFAGNRYGAAVKTIQDSYEVSANKAKFLARQETSLLMTKFKQTRYQEAGVHYYKWVCVTGSAKHPVRPLHKKNDGLVWKWSKPPTVDEHGNKKNPGQDYNCRCSARPLVGYTGRVGVKSPK